MNSINNTMHVSPRIKRQIPNYEELENIKKLNAIVNFDYQSTLVKTIKKTIVTKEAEVLYLVRNGAYQDGYRLKWQGHEFTIFDGPRFNSSYQYSITLNPKDFPCFASYVDFLSSITGKEILSEQHKVTRLDIAFTSPEEVITPALIHYCTHAKWKRRTSAYMQGKVDFEKGRISGVRTNSRSMNLSSYRKPSSKEKLQIEDLTRFEFQLKGASIKSLNLSTLNNLRWIDSSKLFKRIEFYDLQKTTAQSVNDLLAFNTFQEDVLALGFQNARILHNKHRNFHRNIGKFLVPLTINSGKASLSYALRKRFNQWAKKWFNTEDDLHFLSDY
ncbi:hypothetical protein BDW_02370 [Bdellovibrio bacteriovorus W]|nr:hypothetical protein BDW_02370 [Bdellovibrio bacteriovorus W]